jgi:hypothetical protein
MRGALPERFQAPSPEQSRAGLLLSPGPWLVGTTKVYSGVGADIAMESFVLTIPSEHQNTEQAGRSRAYAYPTGSIMASGFSTPRQS